MRDTAVGSVPIPRGEHQLGTADLVPRARIFDMGAELAGSSPKELAAQIASDVKTWTAVVKEAGVRAD